MDENAVADQAVLIAAALLAPPPGSQYEVWLVGDSQRQSLGILTLDGNGRGELTSSDEQGQNLIAAYSGMEVTIEPDPDTDPSSSGIVAYSFTHAQEGLTHLRYLLAAYPNTPSQNALIQGLYTNVATVDELAREMQKASANGNQERLLLNAEAILNLVVGRESAKHKDWNNDGQVDIWMTTEAIASGARVCQSFLGAKIHNPKDPASDLAAMLMQVLGAVFALMEEHDRVWLARKESMPVKLFGFQYEVGVEPVNVNVERMIAAFQLGLEDLAPIWEQILGREVVAELLPLRTAPHAEIHIADDLWVRVVYEAALAYRARVMPREHLLKALTPLYLGPTATFVLETQGLTTAEAEGRIEQLCRVYESRKSYLVERWHGRPQA